MYGPAWTRKILNSLPESDGESRIYFVGGSRRLNNIYYNDRDFWRVVKFRISDKEG